MDRVSTTSEHEGDSGVESTHSSGESFVYIRVSVPELNLQKCLRFNPEETVWVAKQQILSTLAKDLKDESNFGIFCPAVNGRAGKFMDEERLLKDYSLPGPIGFLEFKYKRRVYKQTNVNPRKLKQLHSKSNLKQFMDAVRKMDADKIIKLTDKGLDPNFQDLDSGETPLSLATTLLQPRDVLMALVEGGAIFDFRTRGGLTPVHTAAKMGNVDALGLLLDLGSGVNYRDDRGLTPLYHAVCHSQSSSCVHLLLFNYATVGITDSAGWTELHQACKAGRVQHIEQLLFYGIDINQQNSGGNTALHVAAVNNQEECVRVLLFRGADHTIQNYANQTAVEVAIIANNKQVAKLIREFSPSDVVPIHDAPSYNSKRRGRACATTPSSSHIHRSRSNPPLHSRGSTLTVAMSSQGTLSGPRKPTKTTSGGGGHLEESNEQTSGRVNSGKRLERHGSEPRGGGYDSDSLRSLSISSTSSVSGETDAVVTLRKQIGEGDVIHRTRTVVLPKSSNGYGFVLRGAKCEAAKSNGSNGASTSMLDFKPSAQCPGLQYVEHVDAGGAADRAGLLPGDFIMEINGISVERASHEYAVQLILQTKDELQLSVTTLSVPPNRGAGVGGNNRLSTSTTGGAGTNGHSTTLDSTYGTIRHYGHSRPISMELKSFNVDDDTVQSGVGLSLHESVNAAVPQDCGYWSVPRRGPRIPVRNSSYSNTLMPKQRANVVQDSVYAVPAKDQRRETSKGRSTPPLIPPQDYRTLEFAGSDFVPIATKLPHTYANVSQSSCPPAPAAAAAAADVESSFRPGTNARLSLSEVVENSKGVKRRESQKKLSVANHNDSSEPAVPLAENGNAETRRRRTPGERETRRHSIGGEGNKSPKRDTIGIMVTNIDDVEPGKDYDAFDGDNLPLPPPPPPPPLPPVSGKVSAANAARQNPLAPMLLPPPPTGSELQSFGPTTTATKPGGENSLPPAASGNRGTVPLRSVSDIHADAIRQAVAMRREFVETSDMGNVAATIEHRVQRCRPMQRVLYRAVQAKDSGPTCAVPIALPLSTNGDGFPVDEPVGLYSTGNVSGGNFLSMAEQARQEYIKRRVTSVGPVCSVPSDVSVGHRTDDNNFNHAAAAAAAAAADRGRQRRRVTLAGDEIGQSVGIATKATSFLDPPSGNIRSVVKATNAPADVGRSFGPAESEWSSSSFLSSNVPDHQTSARYSCRSNDGWFTDHCASESESEIILGTMTTTSSSAMSDFGSVDDYESLILPPPPSFSVQSFEIDGSRFAISPDSERTSDSVVTVEYNYNAIPTPPPPPAFNDGRRNAAEVGGDFRSRSITKWTVNDVACWLGSLQMAEHRRSFASNKIDGRRLTQLGRSELIALGVTQVGQRMTMERYIKRALMTNQ